MRPFRPINVRKIEIELLEAEGAVARLESGELFGRADSLRDAVERYQRLCQHYGYLQTVLPAASLTERLGVFILQARRSVYGSRLVRLQKRERYLTRLRRSFSRMRVHAVLSIAVGIIAALFAAAAVTLNPELGWHFLTEDAVAALRTGRLWTEGVKGIESIAAAGIMTNNISVSFLAFVSGATAGALTLLLLFFNGAHLGGIFAVLGQYGMSGRLLDFVVAHGFLELSIIFVSGGAGLFIGDALINPGSMRRWDALRSRVGGAFDVVLFSAACLILAGLVEGYISPHAVPFETKLVLGLLLGSAYWYLLLGRGREG